MSNKLLQIIALDARDNPVAGVVIHLAINAQSAGQILIGSDSKGHASIELPHSNSAVQIAAVLAGQTITENISPQQTLVRFRFSSVPGYLAPIKAVATCPDGTSNSPCVTCSDGTDTWRLCSG